MGVQHELAKRAVDADHRTLQHDKTRAGKLGGGFKIHPRFDPGNVEMFTRGEIKGPGRAPAADFDVVVFIRPLRHRVQRQVRNPHQHVAQGAVLGGGLFGELGDFGLFLGHERAQAFKLGVIPARLGGAHLFRGGVLRGGGGLGRQDLGAAVVVEGQNGGRHRRKAPACEGRIKGGGIFADGADVVHVWASSGKWLAGLCPIRLRGGRGAAPAVTQRQKGRDQRGNLGPACGVAGGALGISGGDGGGGEGGRHGRFQPGQVPVQAEVLYVIEVEDIQIFRIKAFGRTVGVKPVAA